MSKQKTKNAWVIVRVSSDEQKRKTASLESQEKWCNEKVKEMKLDVVKSTKDVISGKAFPKKYFNDIVKIADEKGIDYVVVYAIDRFSRNYVDGGWLLEKIHEKRSIKIVTSNGIFDWSESQGKFLVGLGLLLAEHNQGDRLEKTFRGMITKLKKGEWPLSPPFGYETVDHKLRLIDGYEHVIREVFNTFIRIKNYAETARIINDQYGDSMGFELNGGKVKKIVTDKTYLGYLRWNGEAFGEGEKNHPISELRVVHEKTFEQAQAIARNISKNYSRPSDSPSRQLVEEYGIDELINILNREIPCPECGSTNLQRNGKGKKLKGSIIRHKFNCKDCGHEFRFPSKKQMKKLEESCYFFCPDCKSSRDISLSLDDIILQVKCRKCGYYKIYGELQEKVSGKTIREVKKVKKNKIKKEKRGMEKSQEKISAF